MAKLLLLNLLQEKGLSKRQFAKRLGVEYPTVFRYFRPSYDPKLSMLERWSKVLGVSIFDLIDDRIPARRK